MTRRVFPDFPALVSLGPRSNVPTFSSSVKPGDSGDRRLTRGAGFFSIETSPDTKMAKRYRRACRGHPLLTHTPLGHWKTRTFLAGLRVSGLTAPLVVDGPMPGELLLAEVKQQLAQTRKPGDVVVMDNLPAHQLPAHQVSGVREAIEAVGAQLIYLPPYSPDLNPIETAPNSSTSALLETAS